MQILYIFLSHIPNTEVRNVCALKKTTYEIFVCMLPVLITLEISQKTFPT